MVGDIESAWDNNCRTASVRKLHGRMLSLPMIGRLLKAPASLMVVVGCMLSLIPSKTSLSAPPTLNHLFPSGGQRGSKVIVTCSGTFTWPTKIWSPGVEAVPKTESGQLEVSIPADLPTDRIWIRLYNDEGASTLQPFLIGSLNEIGEVEPNDRPGTPQVVADTSVTINGLLKERDVDCFAVRLEAGQTLVSAVDANTRIGSPMDAILQVVSPVGIVLAENHDDLKLDPRLPFTATQAGTYVVRLFAFPAAPGADIRFSGGASFIYRLTLTTGPYVTHPIPLSVPLDNPGSVGVAGWNIPDETRLNVVPFGGGKLAELGEFEILDEMRRSPDARIGFAFSPNFPCTTRVRMTPYAVESAFSHLEANGPKTIQVSSSVTGCLRLRRQTDAYRIPLSKGQQVVISVEARGLDLPLDPVMKLSDPAGSAIADVDDTGSTRDALIAYTAATDGEYRLTIRDRFGQESDRNWYLLTVRNDEPDFDMAVATDAIVISPDKPTEIAVKVKRSGPKVESLGPITIEAVGLPANVTSTPVISEVTGATASEVKLILTSDGSQFSGPIRIIGKANQTKVIERSARTIARLGVSFETLWLTVIAKP